MLYGGLAARACQLKIGHGLDPTVNLGTLVSKKQHERIKGFMESDRNEGAKVVTRGEAVEGTGYFVEPTVLAQTDRNMRVVRNEIFGPVVCVQSFDDDADTAAARRILAERATHAFPLAFIMPPEWAPELESVAQELGFALAMTEIEERFLRLSRCSPHLARAETEGLCSVVQ